MILILRVYAIYSRAKWVLGIMIPVYLAELAVEAWSVPAGAPAPLPSGFIGCVPSEKAGTGRRLSGIYIAALGFDATIFLLTFGRAIYMRLAKSTIPLAELVIRDGTLYFLVIFVVNLVNVLLLQLAPADLGAINAPFASMITTVLVARLMLNLREAGKQKVLLSNGQTATTHKSMSTWRAAGQSEETDETEDTDETNDRPPRSFHDLLGFDEFDVSLGGETSNSGESSEVDEKVVEYGSIHRTDDIEMASASGVTEERRVK